MASIEILAIIFAVSVILKIILLLVKPQLALRLANMVAKRTTLFKIAHIILFIAVGFFVIINLTMVEVSAVMLFSFILMGLSFASYYPALVNSFSENIKTRKDVIKKFWLPVLIYLIIAIYTVLVVIQPT